MNYSAIKYVDIANGPGCRVSLFVSGCRKHCPGCFNASTWDFEAGQKFTEKTMMDILDALEHDYIRGLTILGGEPMEPENVGWVRDLCHEVKRRYPDKDIWLYSGWTFEEIMGEPKLRSARMKLLEYLDVLVDGSFMEDKKNLAIAFRGSDNQHIIDVQATLHCGDVCDISAQYDHWRLK